MIKLNGKPINTTIFPDNTSQVWKVDLSLSAEYPIYEVKWEFSHEGEFLQLAQLKMLLDQHVVSLYEQNIEQTHLTSIVLSIKYLPYARQDKAVSNETTFALRPFALLLNSLHFNEVLILDPHSEHALALILNSVEAYPIDQLGQVLSVTKATQVCYPDHGAKVKYSSFDWGVPVIHGEKVRDQATGNILSYLVVGDPKSQSVLIIDDICDGGMTFRFLTKDLLAAGATEVNLFVTHGIFSKGLRPLHDAGIKRIFTVDGEAFQQHDGTITYKGFV